MSATSLTFEAPPEILQALNHAASLQRRNRDELLRDALEQYLASDREFCVMVEEGIRQADAGELIEHTAIQSKLAAWTLRSQQQA